MSELQETDKRMLEFECKLRDMLLDWARDHGIDNGRLAMSNYLLDFDKAAKLVIGAGMKGGPELTELAAAAKKSIVSGGQQLVTQYAYSDDDKKDLEITADWLEERDLECCAYALRCLARQGVVKRIVEYVV